VSAAPRTARPRLDVFLVAQGLAESREKAQALIMAGRVRLDGDPAAKPGAAVRSDSRVEVLPGPEHVGRGAIKLAGALGVLGLDPRGAIAVDVGSSTGGFTETLLQRGAQRVYCVDVGRAQLHEKLREDPRVRVLEGVNARALSPREIPDACSFATMDVSFISVLKILPALRSVLAPGAVAAVLVKPQFEVGRADVGRGGIVRDPALHRRCLEGVAGGALVLGYGLRGACASPLEGASGNREFFLALDRDSGGPQPAGFDAMIAAALESQP
jgi:23S rRNA (cytidine1920-2'-O)/16S rRNA (cytidine1409-2'-O)-methyltransferase